MPTTSGLPSSMMPTLWGGNMPSLSIHTSSHTDSVLDQLSQHLSAASRRLSRGSRPHVTPSMRVMKPRSANNSPRSSSTLQSRRRTIMAEGQYHHSLQNDPVPSAISPVFPGCEYQPEATSDLSYPARPVSWHPSSQHLPPQTQPVHAQQQYYQQAPSMPYVFPPYAEPDFAGMYRPPPTPVAYSGFASPASTFSPLSLPYSGFDQQPQQDAPISPSSAWVEARQQGAAPVANQCYAATLSDSNECRARWEGSDASEWNSFAAHGFDRCAAPPTPPYPARAQQPEPRLQSEETIPYVPLEEEEADGEILYGLGLYETPEKPAVDTHIDYHKSVVSSLLGNSFLYPEPTGKGLKLEDAWEPPADDNDDEESSENDSDDAEGEETEI